MNGTPYYDFDLKKRRRKEAKYESKRQKKKSIPLIENLILAGKPKKN